MTSCQGFNRVPNRTLLEPCSSSATEGDFCYWHFKTSQGLITTIDGEPGDIAPGHVPAWRPTGKKQAEAELDERESLLRAWGLTFLGADETFPLGSQPDP